MPTANLDLEYVNGSDYIDPEAFNRNADKIDPLGKCYVVSSGKTGEWRWKKWSDGTAECWIDDKAFPSQELSAWGNMYATQKMSFGAYPFAFKSRPFASIAINSCTNSTHCSFVAQQTTESTTQSPSFVLCDPNNTSIGNPHFGISAKGAV